MNNLFATFLFIKCILKNCIYTKYMQKIYKKFVFFM